MNLKSGPFFPIQCDGVPVNLSDGPALQGITFLNIPSTHGGTNMWGDSKARRMKSSNSEKKRKKKYSDDFSASFTSSVSDTNLSAAAQGTFKTSTSCSSWLWLFCRHWRQTDWGCRAGKLLAHGPSQDGFAVFRKAFSPVFICHHQDQETISNASGWGALGTSPLRGESPFFLSPFYKKKYFLLYNKNIRFDVEDDLEKEGVRFTYTT